MVDPEKIEEVIDQNTIVLFVRKSFSDYKNV